MSIDAFKKLFNSGDRVDEIFIQVQDGQNLKEIAAKVEAKLRKFRDVTEKTQDFTILTPEELLASFGTILNIITAFLLGVAAISLVVGGLGIMNTMYTSVLERTQEIGTMKAIGARNSNILIIFLIESGLLGFVGGLIGAVIGLGFAFLVSFIANSAFNSRILEVTINYSLISGAILFSSLIGILSGILPAYQASKLNPVEALRG